MASLSASSRLVAAALVAAVAVIVVVSIVRPSAGGNAPVPSDALARAEAIDRATATPSPAASSAAPSASVAASSTAPARSAAATIRPTAGPSGCQPTDQDQYIYNPDRLEVVTPCMRVTGTVEAVRHEADGDLHILLALDPPYVHLLTRANQGEELGDLVVEPVCVRTVTQADALDVCASDPDPFPRPFPVVGDRIWMEGRYVFDLQHGGWAELHPLYRWNYK